MEFLSSPRVSAYASQVSASKRDSIALSLLVNICHNSTWLTLAIYHWGLSLPLQWDLANVCA